MVQQTILLLEPLSVQSSALFIVIAFIAAMFCGVLALYFSLSLFFFPLCSVLSFILPIGILLVLLPSTQTVWHGRVRKCRDAQVRERERERRERIVGLTTNLTNFLWNTKNEIFLLVPKGN